jgi:hypothetical protein
MEQLAQARRQAFTHWLRTGRWHQVQMPGGIELKFNPYHDPKNGRFTFAPGGGGSRFAPSTTTRTAHLAPGTSARTDATDKPIIPNVAVLTGTAANQAGYLLSHGRPEEAAAMRGPSRIR